MERLAIIDLRPVGYENLGNADLLLAGRTIDHALELLELTELQGVVLPHASGGVQTACARLEDPSAVEP